MMTIELANTQNYKQVVFDSLDISEATKKDYTYRIDLFLEFLRTEQFTVNTFLHYKQILASRTDYSVSTKNKYLTTARIFLKELHRRGHIPVDTTLNIKSFKQSKKHKVAGLDDEDIARLTNYLQSLSNSPVDLRLRAMIALLLFQGLRQVEIVRLNVEDLDFIAKRAYVRSKGSDDTEPIHLHPETIKAVRSYLRAYSRSHGSLFTPLSGNATARLTTRGLRKIVQTALHKAGVDKTVHGFRHYYATKLIKSYKGDLLRVASYTRHSNLEMLQVYNDSIDDTEDLPRYYEVFESINLDTTRTAVPLVK